MMQPITSSKSSPSQYPGIQVGSGGSAYARVVSVSINATRTRARTTGAAGRVRIVFPRFTVEGLYVKPSFEESGVAVRTGGAAMVPARSPQSLLAERPGTLILRPSCGFRPDWIRPAVG